MHYEVDDKVIKTENAAKSILQPSKWLVDYVKSLPKNITALDYGCGKLRYTIHLANQVKNVYAIDSIIQIDRIQKINSEKVSIREYVKKNMPNTKVFDLECTEWKNKKYDFILCANVLSAIPKEEERNSVLRNIYNLLSKNGQALIVNQHRNSHFKSYNLNPNAQDFFDGWLIHSKNGVSFYGIIPPSKLKEYANEIGFNLVECKTNGESAYSILSAK